MSKKITLQVTDDCNLACLYCYQINKGHHRMSFETAKNFIDFFLKSEPIDSDIILEFSGGEPFMAIEIIDQITTYFFTKALELYHPWAFNTKIYINTNGTLYFKKEVQDYIKKNKNHLILSFSLDGNKKSHDSCRIYKDSGLGSYNDVIKAIKHYNNSFNSSISNKIIITPYNLDYLYDSIMNLFALGVNYIEANYAYENIWHLKDAQKFYQILKNISDNLLKNDQEEKRELSLLNLFNTQKKETKCKCCDNIAIDWKGNIYPCERYMESSLGANLNPFIIGNIETGLGSTKIQRDRIDKLDTELELISPDRCIKCPVSAGCGWCSALNYQTFGTINKRTSFICDMHKARVLANYYFWNNLYIKHGDPARVPILLPDYIAGNYISKYEYSSLVALSNRK